MTRMHRVRVIGREDEHRQVGESVAAARSGQPQVLVVEGEAGIGKSRLVQDALDRLTGPEDLVIVGHGVDVMGGELPLGVITAALRDLIRRVGVDAVREAGKGGLDALNFLVPGLLDEPSQPPDRLRVFDAFATLISRLSHHRFTWFVIEDLHWSDTSSRDMLSYVVRSLDHDTQLMTACTLRTHDTSPHMTAELFADELGRLPNAQTVRLRRLDRTQVADLLHELSPEPPTPAYLDHVVDLSNGVPFLVEELVAAGTEEGGLLPESIATTMLRRIANLRPDTRKLVRVASLGGAHLQHRRLAGVCGLPEEALEAALGEAIATNILETDPDGTGYRFHHDLMRAVVDDSLLPSDRAEMHRRWAEQLDHDTTRDQPLAAIAAAHHWAQTEDHDRAFDAACHAADLAEPFGAESERATLLTRILELWTRVPNAAERAGRDRDTVLLNIIHARGISGSADDVEAAASLLEAELTRADGRDATRTLWLRLELADCWGSQGSEKMETFFGPGSHTLSLLERAPRDRTFVRAVTALATRSLMERSEDSMMELVPEAVQVANDVSEPLEQHLVRRYEVHLLTLLGRHEEALELSAGLVLWAGQQRSMAEVSVTESNHAFQLTVVGRFVEAADLAQRTLARLEKPALSRWAWTFVVENLARALAELGQWDAAEDQLGTALGLNVEGEHRVFLEVEAGLIRCHRGDLATAETYLRSARDRLPESASTWWTALFTVRWLAAEIAVANNDPESARTQLAPLLQREEDVEMSLGWRVLLLAARVEADLAGTSSGRSRAADDSRNRMAELLAFGAAVPSIGDLGTAWQAQLAAESRRCAGTDQAADWEAAVEGWHCTGQIHDEAWAMLRLASCHLASGDKDRARHVLSDALGIGARLRARPLIDAVHAVAGRGRIPLDAPDHTTPGHRRKGGLTQRELEVLRLVADGLRNEQIAQTLFISPKTASVHVSHILAKLGVASRTEAIAVAHREGFLDDA